MRPLLSTRSGIIAAARRILEASDYPMTVRQCYYRLVVEGVVENIPQEYKRVGEALVKARENGEIPYHQIVDRSRSYAAPSHGWDSPEEFLASLAQSAQRYRGDPWDGQDRLVIGVCEKDAMTAVLERLADDLADQFPAVRFTAARGFSSLTLVNAMAKSLQDEGRTRAVSLLYFGDFDPSGEGMCPSPLTMHVLGQPGDLVTRLREQGCQDLEVVKVALTDDQFTQWFVTDGQDRLPYDPNPIKESDSRSKWFRQLYGEYGAELDAVPIDRLRTLLTDELARLIDQGAYRRVLDRQADDRIRLERALSALTLDGDA